jgi:Phage integrase, N-terminal SAM-like domain
VRDGAQYNLAIQATANSFRPTREIAMNEQQLPVSSLPKPKLLDQVRTTIRLRGMSYQTEKTYADWVKRFILFHNKRHPKEMGAPEIRFIFHFPYAICHLSLQEVRSINSQ